MVSPFAMHQQQLAMLAHQQQHQQQSLLTTPAAKSGGVDPKFPGNIQLPGSNGINLHAQNWPNVGYQIPGLVMPVAGQGDPRKLMQVTIIDYINFCAIFCCIQRSSDISTFLPLN